LIESEERIVTPEQLRLLDAGPEARPGTPAPAPASRRPSTLLTVVVAASVAAVVGAGSSVAVRTLDGPAATVAGAPDTDGTGAGGAADGLSAAEIAATVAPSVAAVEVEAGVSPGGQVVTGQGSAVIIDPDGLLATNTHVIDGASSVTVVLADGNRHDAEVVGTDPTTDLAVLRVDATELPSATLADDLPAVGATAIAIGSPFGLEGSVTSGIVSALDRSLVGEGGALTGLIQTDAAINPGNSGGALVDDQGRVIGINTAILSSSGTNDGVGFAVPAPTIRDITDQLIETGTVSRAVLGVAGQDVDPRVAAAYDLSVETGALLVRVEPGSAAATAGLRPGDLVTGAGGEPVTSMADLATIVQAHEPGEHLELELLREGRTVDLVVELG
jgi:S1-C subfamily serine protease